MTNAKGRRFLRNLLQVAAQLALGMKGQEYFVFDVGSSNNRSEGLPVRKRKEETADDEDENLNESLESASVLNMERKTPTRTPCVSSPSSTVGSKSSGRVAKRTGKRKTTTGGYIYPDCVVAARDESGFSRYLIVAELKSGGARLSEGERAQLYREMLGAGVHQTEVFGILVNAAESLIVRMQLRNDSEEIHFFEKSYDFTLAKKESLNLEEFSKFFKDLLVVMSYAMENVKLRHE